MRSDIVEKLRESELDRPKEYGGVGGDAADEIERLRNRESDVREILTCLVGAAEIEFDTGNCMRSSLKYLNSARAWLASKS